MGNTVLYTLAHIRGKYRGSNFKQTHAKRPEGDWGCEGQAFGGAKS